MAMMNHDLTFEKYFRKNIKSGADKLTVVLGSGFHSAALKTDSLLTSWEVLLKTIDPNIHTTEHYLLDFENYVITKNKTQQASEFEDKIVKKVAQKIKAATDHVLKTKQENYPSFLFNPAYVADVISLNFDELAEELCRRNEQASKTHRGYINIEDSGEDTILHRSTRYQDVIFKKDSRIRFWHPHGSVHKPSSIILGARSYSLHMTAVESLRMYSKVQEKPKAKKINDTWYDKIINQPVVVLGASMSAQEWDLWSAIVNRERNFSKNKKSRKPIYHMRSFCTHEKVSTHWLQPLFPTLSDYETQWSKLKEMFQ